MECVVFFNTPQVILNNPNCIEMIAFDMSEYNALEVERQQLVINAVVGDGFESLEFFKNGFTSEIYQQAVLQSIQESNATTAQTSLGGYAEILGISVVLTIEGSNTIKVRFDQLDTIGTIML